VLLSRTDSTSWHSSTRLLEATWRLIYDSVIYHCMTCLAGLFVEEGREIAAVPNLLLALSQ